MDYGNVAILGGLVAVYSLIAGGIEKTLVGGAIFFTVAGVILGPHVLDVLTVTLSAGSGLGALAELTLAVLLFVDAAGADFGVLRRSAGTPVRLLLVGLPMVIVAGILVGLPLFPTLGIFEIALLATILAPTDAALGKAVVSDKNVPDRIRTSLNFESGLNDGICVPIFLAFMAFSLEQADGHGFVQIATHLIIEEIGIGAAVGLAIAGLGAIGFSHADQRGWVSEVWVQVTAPAFAVASFMAAQALGGSGFIAAFVGGLLFGALVKERKHALLLGAESTGEVLALLTWVVFGAIVVGNLDVDMRWEYVVYAVLSLTVVRMVPIWLAFRGAGAPESETLFMAWFGPRGLASVVFTIMAIEADVPGANIIAGTVACAIVLSILAHGISAKPLSRLLARRLQ